MNKLHVLTCIIALAFLCYLNLNCISEKDKSRLFIDINQTELCINYNGKRHICFNNDIKNTSKILSDIYKNEINEVYEGHIKHIFMNKVIIDIIDSLEYYKFLSTLFVIENKIGWINKLIIDGDTMQSYGIPASNYMPFLKGDFFIALNPNNSITIYSDTDSIMCVDNELEINLKRYIEIREKISKTFKPLADPLPNRDKLLKLIAPPSDKIGIIYGRIKGVCKKYNLYVIFYPYNQLQRIKEDIKISPWMK